MLSRFEPAASTDSLRDTVPPTNRPAASPLPRSLFHPLVVSSVTAASLLASYGVWHRFLRRIRSTDDLRRGDFSPRRLHGVVVGVRDPDNLRLWHRPLLRRFQKPPVTRAGITAQTLHVRLAGIDAPELAHWGNPEQPYAREALDLLSRTALNQPVSVELYQKDRYNRVVGHAYLRRSFPFFRRRCLSEIMLEEGLATVYEQEGAVVSGAALERFRALEAKARKAKKGMWAQGAKYESPAEYKRRTRAGAQKG
ncbi:hypothetical protein JCM10213_008604 [Rhodosporidiobolus nylandii]